MAAPTFLVFSNCEEILVIMPSAATKDSRDSTCGQRHFLATLCVTSMRAKTIHFQSCRSEQARLHSHAAPSAV